MTVPDIIQAEKSRATELWDALEDTFPGGEVRIIQSVLLKARAEQIREDKWGLTEWETRDAYDKLATALEEAVKGVK